EVIYIYTLINKFRRSKLRKVDNLLEEKRNLILLKWVNGKSESEIIERYGDFGQAVIKAEKARLSFPAFIK
ncbi:MAG: hypothetical protein ACRC4Y_00145, partial [Cetobacterium sp.]